MLSGMNKEMEDDPELARCLKQWRVPGPTAALDERVFAAYVQRNNRRHFWSRFPAITVPLPVASAVALAMLLMAFSIVRRPERPTPSLSEGAMMLASGSTGSPVITSLSLAGFLPVDDINVSVFSAISKDALP